MVAGEALQEGIGRAIVNLKICSSEGSEV